jgi:hypothetical protein
MNMVALHLTRISTTAFQGIFLAVHTAWPHPLVNMQGHPAFRWSDRYSGSLSGVWTASEAGPSEKPEQSCPTFAHLGQFHRYTLNKHLVGPTVETIPRRNAVSAVNIYNGSVSRGGSTLQPTVTAALTKPSSMARFVGAAPVRPCSHRSSLSSGMATAVIGGCAERRRRALMQRLG